MTRWGPVTRQVTAGGSPSGAAGGSLSGTYPNPSLAAGAVTGAEVAAAIKDPAVGTAGLRTLGTGATQAAAGDHKHAGADITSGTVAAARLGSGVPSSANYLRGDGTWTSPPGGAPSGAAGGSLAGTYPNPTVAAGAIGGTEIAAGIKDPAAATAGLRTLGTGAAQAAAGNHQHDSADLISGIIAAARLASGVGDSTKYLRGDSTWQVLTGVVPGGAAGGSLAGTYPNPTIAAGSITGTEIAAAIKDPAAGTAGLRTLGTGATQAASGTHVHDAAAITTGTIGLARLGGGAPSSSTWLRGDGIWSSIASTTRKGASFVVAAADASGVWNADYTCDGINDEVQIQAAIDACPLDGGSVELSDGHFNVNGDLKMKTGVEVRGQGGGTALVAVSFGASVAMFTLANVNTHATCLRNVLVDGAYIGTGKHGVWYDNTAGDFNAEPFTDTDPCHRIVDCFFLHNKGCGIICASSATAGETAAGVTSSSGGNTRGMWIEGCFIYECSYNGIYYHGPDSFISGTVVGSAGRSGFVAKGNNCRWVNCKSYYSAWHGWTIAGGRSSFSALEAQDNVMTGFYFSSSCDQCTATGLVSDSNGTGGAGDGFFIGCSRSIIEGVTFDRAANGTKQRYGVNFGGGTDNIIDIVVDITNFSGAAPKAFTGSRTGQLALRVTTNDTDANYGALDENRLNGRTYITMPSKSGIYTVNSALLGANQASFYIDQDTGANTGRQKVKVVAKDSGGNAFTANLSDAQDIILPTAAVANALITAGSAAPWLDEAISTRPKLRLKAKSSTSVIRDIILGADLYLPNAQPASADIANGYGIPWQDETSTTRPKLKVRHKTSSGTVIETRLGPDAPFHDEVVTPGGRGLDLVATTLTATVALAANTVYGQRFRAPFTGYVRGLYIWVGAGSGNVRGVVYEADTSAVVLFDGGTVSAAATTNAWLDLGDPGASGLLLNEGDYFDCGVVLDNATITLGHGPDNMAHGNVNNLHADFATLGGTGASSKMQWTRAITFPTFDNPLTDALKVVSNHDVSMIVRMVRA